MDSPHESYLFLLAHSLGQFVASRLANPSFSYYYSTVIANSKPKKVRKASNSEKQHKNSSFRSGIGILYSLLSTLSKKGRYSLLLC